VVSRSSSSDAELKNTIEAFDRAFSEGRLEEFSEFFAGDAQLLVHQQETVVGKEAIRASFGPVFDGFDTSAYEPRYETIDVHGDRAYVLASFSEVLRPRDGQPGIRIRGRVVQFWRREDAVWRIARLLTARSAADESTG
jgi:ketosteroid isomerase-like protein